MKNATKKAIAEALKHLLLKKPINDIAEECGISRMTFYYHFKDIYDLVEWICEEEARSVISDNRTYETWEQGFLSLLETFKANKPFVMNIYHSVEREQIERYMLRLVEKLLDDVVREQAYGLKISDAGKHSVSAFYTYAFLGVVLEWVRGGMIITPQEVVRSTATIIQGDFRNSLENVSRMETGAK